MESSEGLSEGKWQERRKKVFKKETKERKKNDCKADENLTVMKLMDLSSQQVYDDITGLFQKVLFHTK